MGLGANFYLAGPDLALPAGGPGDDDCAPFLPAVANRDQLSVQLPQATFRGLSGCALGSVSEFQESLKVHRAITRDVLAQAQAGVWLCQEGRKKVRIDAGMRYSPGAALP
jgi:hypothetical protein